LDVIEHIFGGWNITIGIQASFFLQSLTTVLNFSVDEEEIIGEFIRLTLTHRDSVPLAAANNNPAI
jgi:hypothetical protein